jgi:hypothetical protein
VAELSEESDTVEVESVTPTGREDEHRDFEESTEEERVGKVCRRIREIDAQYGSTPNNPRVAELLAQLGTHYDSIERVIETVYSLQLEEVIEEQKTQAAERIRERKWLKSERSFES